MADKQMTLDDLVGELDSGMTIGIGGWGSRRKPMAAVRALLRSDLTDLTVVSYGGPDVGLLCAAGKVAKVVFGFVTLDSIPTDPHFRVARQSGAVEALVHVNRADARGSGQILGPDPFFDELFLGAADRRFVTTERLVATEQLASEGALQTMCISRLLTDGVVETPGGAHFTACVPDYGRDEAFQKEYVAAAGDPDAWAAFSRRYLEVAEDGYQAAVTQAREDRASARPAEQGGEQPASAGAGAPGPAPAGAGSGAGSGQEAPR